jgi:hypothetical protein
MENLILAICLYVAIVAIAYQPKKVVDIADNLPATPKSPAAAKPIAKPVTITQPLPVATFQMSKPANTNGDRRLESMTIRQLYALASAKGIKRYKSMKKPELIAYLG